MIEKTPEKIFQDIKDVTAVAVAPGNANTNHYMRGMANGLILAEAIIEDKEPKYIEADAVNEFTVAQYQAEAQRTKSEQFHVGIFKVQCDRDILHAVIGIATEGAELLDPVKKAMFYGRELDMVNLDEEIGDILWYVAIYCEARGIKITDLMRQNNAKLKARYPEKFGSQQALFRNLAGERETLEQNDPHAKALSEPQPLKEVVPLAADDEEFAGPPTFDPPNKSMPGSLLRPATSAPVGNSPAPAGYKPKGFA